MVNLLKRTWLYRKIAEIRELVWQGIVGQQKILVELQKIEEDLARLLPKAVKITIQFQGEQPGMAAQITDTQQITATIAELDAKGQPVAVDPTKVQWTVGDPTVASVQQNADGSATFTALKVGTTQVAVTDSSNGLSAQDTLTVTAGAATTLQIAFGTPVDQAAAPAPAPAQ